MIPRKLMLLAALATLFVLLALATPAHAQPRPHPHRRHAHVSLMNRLGQGRKETEAAEKRRSAELPDQLRPIKATYVKANVRAVPANRAHVIGFDPVNLQTGPFERFSQQTLRSAMKNILHRMN